MLTQKNKAILYAVLTLSVLLGGGYWVADRFSQDAVPAGGQSVLTVGGWWNKSSDQAESAQDPEQNTGTPDDSADNSPNMSPDGLTQVYADDVYDFSFKLPENLTSVKMPEESGDLILVQGAGEKTFQIFISPFDEPASALTPERVKSDLPNMIAINSQQIVIGGEQIQALMFNSKHESLGDTREVWFVWPPDPLPHGNYLYQVTAYANSDAFLGSILETWSFQ